MRRPFFLYILCVLHLFLGVTATVGGCLLIGKPDGSLIGMAPDWLEGSLFESYFIPGIILLTINGFGPLFIAKSLLHKPKWHGVNVLNLYPNRHWAWTYSLYSGIIVVIWIAFQILLTRNFWLQPIIILVGVMIIISTMMPNVMRYFEIQNPDA